MPTETEEKKTPAAEKTEATAEAKKEPSVASTKAVEKSEATSDKAEKGGDTSKKVETKGATKLDAEDDLPEDGELFELSRSALLKRLNRHTAKELRERFGTSDFADIQKKLARAEELEKKEEERERAAMSEREKLEADLKKERGLRADAERTAKSLQISQVVDKEENRISKIAEKFFKAKYLRVVLKDYAEHLNSEYTDEQLKGVKDKDIEKWFSKELENQPELGRDFGTQTKEESVTKQPFTNGVKGDQRPAASGSSGKAEEKSFKPGGPNSMSSQEARAEAAKQGLRW